MMLDALLGGLVGSILTVVARELLEILRDSKLHSYSLQKYYFEKKLKSAEAASSVWLKSTRTFAGLEGLYEQLSLDDNEKIDEEVFQMIHESFSQQLNTLYKETDEIANSIFLYFDIDDKEFFDNEPLAKLIEKLSKIKSLNDKLDRLFDLEEKFGAQESTTFKNEIIDTKIEIREEFSKLGKILKATKQSTLKLLKRARSEMKKFEP